MTASEKNLYDFYDTIGEIPGVTKVSDKLFSMIQGDSSPWPRVIYHLNDASCLPGILNKTTAGSIEKTDFPIAVINRKWMSAGAADILRNIPAFPVELWELMEASRHESIEMPLTGNQEIEIIHSREGIDEFTGIVNQFMMGHMKVNNALFYAMSEINGFDFFCIRKHGRMISTLLSFSATRISGLYFIVTRPELRGKGYAETLIRYVLNFLFLQGKEKVVLQAGRKAVPLYLRAGFVPVGQMVVIRKV